MRAAGGAGWLIETFELQGAGVYEAEGPAELGDRGGHQGVAWLGLGAQLASETLPPVRAVGQSHFERYTQ